MEDGQSADPSGPLVCVCVCISGLEYAVAVEKGKDILHDVPFRVSTGARLDVA